MSNFFRDVVCDLIIQNGYKRIAEIGIWKGDLSRMILNKCNPDYLLLVDPMAYELNNMESGYKCTMGEPVKEQSDLDVIAEKIRELNVDFMRMPSLEAVINVPDESLDFVFIDAVHLFEYVKADIEAWLPKVRKGGILAGDDYYEKHGAETRKAIEVTIKDVEVRGKVWYYKVK